MEAETTALPAAVRKQGEDAEALYKRLYPDQYPKTGGEQTGKPEDRRTDAAKPEETKETPKPPEPAKPEAKPEPSADEWKQRYETLQGKYNAEVPQLHQIAAGLRNQLQETLQRVKTLEEEKAQGSPKDPEKSNGGGEEEITDPTLKTFSEEYPDIFEAVKKMVGKPKETAKPEPAKPAEPTAPPASDARRTMLYFLTRDVPAWKEINRDPQFIQSLQEIDSRTGTTKLESLNLAWNANDFTSVIGYFRDYKPGTPPAAAPAPAGEKELTAEEKALAPPKGGRPPGPAGGGDQNTVTPQDLANFYNDARKGYWGPITDDRYRKEEARLLAALMRAKK